MRFSAMRCRARTSLGQAKSRFDAVLAFDPGNATALRGRAELELRPAMRRLPSSMRKSWSRCCPIRRDDRLLLARCYSAAGNKAWVDRTLWTAFQDIPADEKIYAALRATRKGDPDATRELAGRV